MAGKTPPDGTGSAHVPEVAPGARQPQPDPPRPGGRVGGGGGRPADVSDPRGVVAGRGRRRGTGEPDPGAARAVGTHRVLHRHRVGDRSGALPRRGRRAERVPERLGIRRWSWLSRPTRRRGRSTPLPTASRATPHACGAGPDGPAPPAHGSLPAGARTAEA